MILRRAVALLLLVAVFASSVRVLFGLESSIGGAEAHVGVAMTGADSLFGSPEEADDDCFCLCACGCSGAQLVVGPAEASAPVTRVLAEPPAVESLRASTLPTPRPPHRPPLV